MALFDLPEIIAGEQVGTAGNDSFSTMLNSIVFGLAGNDSFTGQVSTGTGPTFVGGAGNDFYDILNGSNIIVADHGGGDDTLRALGIGPDRDNTFGATIDGGRHLLLFDEDSDTEVLVLNWLDPDLMIETYIGAGGIAYSTAQVQALISDGDPQDLGDLTWEQQSEGEFTTAEIRTLIADATARADALASGAIAVLNGSAAIDTLVGGQTADSINLGAGNDSAWGLPGDDVLSGEAGNDRLFGNAGEDTLLGGDGNDTLRGQFNDDQLLGGNGHDLIFGGANNDTIEGSLLDDTINGNSGNDSIVGGVGDDVLRGQAGLDIIFGGDGDDMVLGMQGADQLFGGNGNDQITGGPANDTMTGGAGADIFIFAALQGANVITDFADNVDKISLVGVASFAALTIVDGAGGATVTFEDSPTTSITLTGIAANQLTAADFFFG
ncbi:MAG: calcium-binding protein [Alphaproteobacteria bacterium]